MATERTFVIVGASLAGAKSAETLREEGFDGRIVLLGAESERPYERPPLSKEYLRREAEGRPYVHPEAFYAENDIELRTSTPVTAIDPSASEVTIGEGERISYERLLLATGAEPRRLSLPGGELDGVHYLRELADSDAIGDRVAVGARVVVIGTGWIGAEVAASARERGCEVTIVGRSSVPLERVLGPEVGAIYRDIHTDHGVRFLAGTGVESLEGAGRVERVRTSNGEVIDADLVVVGVGVAPRVELAEAAGIQTENGILVDEVLRSSAPNVFAAGDVANAQHPLFRRPIRIEHWANALDQGPAAARSMLDKKAPYDKIPYFFSDQYDVGMEYGGYATSWDEIVFRGDVDGREFIAFWVEGGRVVAGMNVNIWEVNDRIRELISSRTVVDANRLANLDVPLEELAAEGGQAGEERSRASGPPHGFLARGVNFARRFVAARVAKPDAIPISELRNGEAKVIGVDGDKVAAYRDRDGSLNAVSAVCTHMGCLVEWNEDEETWDCPCHDSRFDPNGRVIRGPAKRDLEQRRSQGSSAQSA
jgi:3-phenylpropionate/trans-cinnamate dioxygenase ferredoxin reductase component